MTARKTYRADGCKALAGGLALLVFSACSGEPDAAGDNSLLRYVPADTPYVFASGEPLDDEFLDALQPHIDELLASYRELFEAAASAEADDGTPGTEAMSELFAQLSPLFTIDGLEKAGIERDAEFVFYGNGLLPVLRFEVRDAEAFEKTIAGIEGAAGDELPTAELDGNAYRYIEDEKVRVIIGLFDGTAVVTAMPATGFDDTLVRELLGFEPPAKSLAGTTVLQEIVEQYGFSRHYVGYVDSLRLVDSILDEPASLDAALLAAAEFDPATVSPVCEAEIREVAGIAPRAVIGYDEISLERIGSSFVVELREDLATGMQGLSAAVPGLGKDQGGVLEIGASLNMAAFREFYAARLDAMEKDPFECEYFADIQAGVPKAREALNQSLAPVVYGIRGFNAVLDKFDTQSLLGGQPPEPGSVEATVVVAMQDAASLVAMGMMFSPELAALNLQPNGEAVELALPELEAMAITAYAAMLENALSIAVGPAAETRVTTVLEAESKAPPPMAALSLDAATYYEFIAAAMAAEPEGDEEPMPPEMVEPMQDVMKGLGDIYDRMTTVVHFTERGMEVNSVITLKDL
ncbi:MAG TPA: hypothetical protein VFY03_12450 [Woeseiaceae bacterium]|nr:hypothetical protein [Woeseiaceae bacterium]